MTHRSCLIFSILLTFLIHNGIACAGTTDSQAHSAKELTEAEWASNWEELGNKEGITTYKKEMVGTPAVAVMGRGTVDAPIAKVVSVIADVDHATDWVDLMDESRYLQKDGEGKGVLYQHFNTPFVIRNRDFVLSVKPEINAITKAFVLRFHSVDHPLAPPPSKIRSYCHGTIWSLTPSTDGKTTTAEVKALIDPRGSVPKWLVNWGQKSWPRDTLLALRKQVTKRTAPDSQLYATLLGKK